MLTRFVVFPKQKDNLILFVNRIRYELVTIIPPSEDLLDPNLTELYFNGFYVNFLSVFRYCDNVVWRDYVEPEDVTEKDGFGGSSSAPVVQSLAELHDEQFFIVRELIVRIKVVSHMESTTMALKIFVKVSDGQLKHDGLWDEFCCIQTKALLVPLANVILSNTQPVLTPGEQVQSICLCDARTFDHFIFKSVLLRRQLYPAQFRVTTACVVHIQEVLVASGVIHTLSRK